MHSLIPSSHQPGDFTGRNYSRWVRSNRIFHHVQSLAQKQICCRCSMIVDGSDWPYQARVKIFECKRMDRRGGDGIALATNSIWYPFLGTQEGVFRFD